ncbi:MAG TPA: 16S rRNA (cytidine(1402)-2'-O)-methyltransferase, partial [Thermodesulfobacteriota bacterium]|nr:16S rRNA (cytidine(1402)-2'-O)-methyltransferase [Thermodesulfobacteriota bacterium]
AEEAAARAPAAAEGIAEDDELEHRALEQALRAEQPQSAADIGAFDEREQALLKDAWPDAPVRGAQGGLRRRSQHGPSMEETFEARREKMAEERRARKGTLYVVAVPAGNLEDVSYRAVRILKEVKLVAADEPKLAGRLLAHYQIKTPLAPLTEQNDQVRLDPLLRRLEEGQPVALVIDASVAAMPERGGAVVRAAIERGVPVVPVPGPSAVVAALSASGLPADAWVFVGPLPQKEKRRRDLLESLKLDRRTLVFYETGPRAYDTIKELCDVLGNRDMVMFRELTKPHEETIRGKFSKVLAEFRGKEIKGDVVLVVAGWAGQIADREGLSLLERIRLYKQESGLPLADVVRLVARETGKPKSEVYREALRLLGVDPDQLRQAAGVPAPAAAGVAEAAAPAPP